ncbi:hypothetical protein [Aquipuribacter hungaricus]
MAKIGKEDQPITVEPDAPFEAPAEPAPATQPVPEQVPVPSPS